MVKIKDFTLASKNLGGARAPPVPYTPPAHGKGFELINDLLLIPYCS